MPYTDLPPFDPPGLVDAAESAVTVFAVEVTWGVTECPFGVESEWDEEITSGVVIVVVEVCVSVEVDASSSGDEDDEIISGDVVKVVVVDEVECGISKVCFDPSCILKIVFIHFSLFKK